MSGRKKLLVFSNFSKIHTGFGGNKKRVLRWFYKQPDWEVVEAAAGMPWDAPECLKMPWKCYGTAPTIEQQQQIAQIQDEGQRNAAARNATYGNMRIDEIIKLEQPSYAYFCEDSWAFDDVVGRKWNDVLPTLYHITFDSIPLLNSQIDLAAKCSLLFPWANFATEEFKKLEYSHVKTLAGTVDPEEFRPISEDRRNSLRKKFGLEDSFVFLKLGRSQLRKHYPNLMDGFVLFKQKNPQIKAKLLFHCSWQEGWDIPKLIKDKGVDPNDILTTYYCKECRQWEIRPFFGHDQDCPLCGAKKSYSTCSISHGVTEEDIRDIYGMSDLVFNLASSGGFEYAVWQAKMCEKICATTSYSCGLDACTEESGGWPINWSAYMEPGSQFVKATSCPKSVCETMEKFVALSPEERKQTETRARKFAIEWCSTDKVCQQIKETFEKLPPANWESFSWEPQPKNPSHNPPQGLSQEEFVIDLFKNILHEKVDKNTSHVKNWTEHLKKSNDFNGVLQHFRNLAAQHNAQLENKPIDLADLLDKDDESRRIALIMPESGGDLILINSLLKKFKSLYPEYNLYFFTKPEFFDLIDGHPSVHKVLPYSPVLDNIFFMEGSGSHKGFFTAAFYPYYQTQRHLAYQHNQLEARAEWLNCDTMA